MTLHYTSSTLPMPRLGPPQPARPSVRGQVQLDLFTTDGDIAEAMAAVEPYLPGADGIEDPNDQ